MLIDVLFIKCGNTPGRMCGYQQTGITSCQLWIKELFSFCYDGKKIKIKRWTVSSPVSGCDDWSLAAHVVMVCVIPLLHVYCHQSKSFFFLFQVHFFNSFFYDKLRTKGYEGVKRWTKNVSECGQRTRSSLTLCINMQE